MRATQLIERSKKMMQERRLEVQQSNGSTYFCTHQNVGLDGCQWRRIEVVDV
jgi:hypothetical protein